MAFLFEVSLQLVHFIRIFLFVRKMGKKITGIKPVGQSDFASLHEKSVYVKRAANIKAVLELLRIYFGHLYFSVYTTPRWGKNIFLR